VLKRDRARYDETDGAIRYIIRQVPGGHIDETFWCCIGIIGSGRAGQDLHGSAFGTDSNPKVESFVDG